jgi:4-amino-4-deoxychorismate lyase
MKIEKVSIDGLEQNLSAIDETLARDYGAFESFRLHKGRVFLLDEHFDRLKRSLSALSISWDDNREKYCSWISDLCQGLPEDKDAFVRFVVTSAGGSPTTSIHVGYIPFFAPKSHRAVVLDKTKLAKPEYFAKTGFRIKSVNYIKDLINTRKSAGLDAGIEGILLTPDGYVAEGLTSNIFWSKAGELHTPPLDTGILAGTMRGYLLTKNKVKEELAGEDILMDADEIILTSGASYLRPLSEINSIQKTGVNGPVFKKLYKELIVDIEKNSKDL